MERRSIHIRTGLLAIGFLLLAVGCSSSDNTEEPQPTMLTIYVYSPEHPMLIRGTVGNVDALVAESSVHKLQIWIFKHGTAERVGYLETEETSLLNISEGAVYQIPVDDDFAQNKPNVDVYVLANVTDDNCGCAFDMNSTRTTLESAQIDADHFGLTTLITEVPEDGLPMAGVLKDQEVVGDAPVLRIDDSGNIATVLLERVVSKVRFVFGTAESGMPTITGITINANMLYTEGYLIPHDALTALNLKSSETSLLSSDVDIETEDTYLSKYSYVDQEAQEYETLINDAVAEGKLTVIGPYYLKESDKRLAGTISYKIGEEAKDPAPFQMKATGDFLRNHSWIVYVYYTGGGYLQTDAIYVKKWTTKEVGHEVYNW